MNHPDRSGAVANRSSIPRWPLPVAGLVLVLVLVLAIDDPAGAQAFRRYPAEEWHRCESVSFASFSADEQRVLFTSDRTGVPNLYVAGAGGGEPKALTSSTTDSIRGLAFFPGDDRAVYAADRGGDERDHVFVRELDGSVLDLTPGEDLKALWFGFGADEKTIWIATNGRDPKHFDLWRYRDAAAPAAAGKDPAARYPRELVFQNDGGFMIGGVSLDGRWLALEKIESAADGDLYLVDLAAETKTPRLVTKHDGEATHAFGAFAPDGRTLWYLSNKDSEWERLWSFDLAKDRHELALDAGWDVASVSFSRNGRYRVVTVNEDARTRMTVTDLQARREVEIPESITGEASGAAFSRSARYLALTVGSDVSPPDIHVVNVADGGTARLTRALSPAIDPAHLAASVGIRYPSFDGREIPALLYKPWTATLSRRAPAVVLVHGGPGGQSRAGWDAEIQALVNHGIGVLAVNNRGSSGYGKTFFHLDDRNHGDGDLKDCIAGRKYLEELGWVDPARVGIMGGSYGGFMVAAALTLEPDAFACGVNLFGVTNWLRTLRNIPPWWEAYRKALYREMGDPETDAERLARISPVLHADRIKKPLLVVQGVNDPRVPRVESDDLVAAVRKNGVPVEYVLFADEGHGFTKTKNRVTALKATIEFLNKRL